jgi:predicted ATPase
MLSPPCPQVRETCKYGRDPLLLFSVLYRFWAASYTASNGDAMRELSTQFLAHAEGQSATGPLLIAHRMVGVSLACTGDIAQGRPHFDRAIALYDPSAHRPLASRFGQDARVTTLDYRSWAHWLLEYPEGVIADIERSLEAANEIGQAASLMLPLGHAPFIYLECGDYAKAKAIVDELVALANEKGALFWKAFAMMNQG